MADDQLGAGDESDHLANWEESLADGRQPPRQPRAGPLTAEACVVHRGRRLLSTECRIEDAEHNVLARSTATFMIVPS